MRTSHFFRYTFTRRSNAMLAVVTVSSALATWGLYEILPEPVNRYAAAGAVLKYVAFCSFFLIHNIIRWRRYYGWRKDDRATYGPKEWKD